jgi:glycosyltransferase involved in cell wall biosynthesis
MKLSSASIIIPSLNSPILDQVIASILAQNQSQIIREVVVVGKDDAGLLPIHPLVRFIDTRDAVAPATARNIGIQASSGELVCFLDSDCVAQGNWLEEHMTAHEVGHPIVGGSVLPEGDGFWQRSYNLAMFNDYYPSARPGPRQFLPTLNLSVERWLIDKVGLLNEELPRSQDLEWTTRMYRSGHQPFFWPGAIINHRHNRDSLVKIWHDCARSGYYASQVRWQYRDTLNSPPLLARPRMMRILSPVIAAWVTLRIIFLQPGTIAKNWTSLPIIYLSKIAWCWGASRAD